MTGAIAVEVSGGVQTIRLSRPEKKNAITSPMYEAMADALAAADERTDVAATLILGRDGVFSAGNDMAEFLDYAKGGALGGAVIRFLKTLATAHKPLIAAVDGLAIGVGTTMLLHCDLVYASPRARFRTPFLDLGLVPEAASSLLLPMRIGPQRAFEMLCLGSWMDAERACAAGLVNAVVPEAELETQARAAAAALAAKPQEALAAARRLIRGDPSAVLARIDEEVRIFAERLRSAEAREAFTAFLEKRPPDFARLARGGA
jgi:enoyl-CoA hydratase/carnithine racemase